MIGWVADHRKHHAHADEEGDPHSPHVGHDGETPARCAGSGTPTWAGCSTTPPRSDAEKYAPDLVEDRGMRLIRRLFPLWVTLGLVVPAGSAGSSAASCGRAHGLLLGRPRARLPRPPRDLLDQLDLPLLRPAALRDRRRVDQRVLARRCPSFGESWHHNHHAFPRSALHGLRWWEVDLGGLVIRAMRRLGLAWNVVLITPERQEQRARGGAELRPNATSAPRRAP